MKHKLSLYYSVRNGGDVFKSFQKFLISKTEELDQQQKGNFSINIHQKPGKKIRQ